MAAITAASMETIGWLLESMYTLLGLKSHLETLVDATITGHCWQGPSFSDSSCRRFRFRITDNTNIACIHISSRSLPIRLVSVTALLRRYSPSLHPLLRWLSHVPALPSSGQSYYAYNSVLPCARCQLYTTMFRGPKSAPREPK